MFLLQSQTSSAPGFLIFALILRIVGALVCSNRAKELNRSAGGWGFFGFVMPIVAMIWVYCIKPKVVWSEVSEKNKEV